MPIYHIIGNVTSNAAGKVTNVESINDVSSAILYKGIYHICARPTPAHRLNIRPSELHRSANFSIPRGDSTEPLKTACTRSALFLLPAVPA